MTMTFPHCRTQRNRSGTIWKKKASTHFYKYTLYIDIQSFTNKS